jgi:hypothetical protein
MAFYRIVDGKITESYGDLGTTVRDELVSGGSDDDAATSTRLDRKA